MGQTTTARRYAKALLELAQEVSKVEEVKQDMVLLQQTISESKELGHFLKSPIIQVQKKNQIIKQIFENKFKSELTSKYIDLITKNAREALLLEIANQYIFLYKEHNKIKTVKTTTAIKIDDNLKKQILSVVDTSGNEKIELEEVIDSNIIGGFILQIGDQQINASTKYALDKLRNNLINN